MGMTQPSAPGSPAVGFASDAGVPVIRESLSQDEQLDFDGLLGPRGGARNALLGMADVARMHTPCIAWLVAAHRRLEELGGKLVLHSLQLRARETLAFLGLDRVLHIADDEAAALRLL